MKNTYFAITSYKNINLPEGKILSKKPYEIILKNINPLHLTEQYKTEEQGDVERDLSNILNWLADKKGNILFVDESSICLSSGTIYSLINSVDYSSPFWAITNINRDGVCAFCANIEALLSKINDADLSFNNLDDLYLKLLSSNVNSIEISNDEKLQIEGSINYGQIYKYLSLTINENFMKRGVFIMDTNSTYIGFDVKIGAGTLIYPNNTINGDTSIGKNCTLFSNNHIENAKIGDNNKIKASVMFDCIIGNNNEVGPFAYIRPQSSIADNCKIGDFVEIKNSSIDDHTKISHLTYVGDSDLGKNINLGCGVVFVNYDGKLKHRSTVGDNAFIGCNTNIISPITISNNAFIAAGSTVTEDVPEYAFYIARSKGTIKENWVKDRHEKGKI